MILNKNLFTIIIALFTAFTVEAQEIKENSSDKRLMKNITTVTVLDNGMVIYEWEWNDIARQLNPKYGMSVDKGGFESSG